MFRHLIGALGVAVCVTAVSAMNVLPAQAHVAWAGVALLLATGLAFVAASAFTGKN